MGMNPVGPGGGGGQNPQLQAVQAQAKQVEARLKQEQMGEEFGKTQQQEGEKKWAEHKDLALKFGQ